MSGQPADRWLFARKSVRLPAGKFVPLSTPWSTIEGGLDAERRQERRDVRFCVAAAELQDGDRLTSRGARRKIVQTSSCGGVSSEAPAGGLFLRRRCAAAMRAGRAGDGKMPPDGSAVVEPQNALDDFAERFGRVNEALPPATGFRGCLVLAEFDAERGLHVLDRTGDRYRALPRTVRGHCQGRGAPPELL